MLSTMKSRRKNLMGKANVLCPRCKKNKMYECSKRCRECFLQRLGPRVSSSIAYERRKELRLKLKGGGVE